MPKFKRHLFLILGITLVAALAFIDYLTGAKIRISFLYLIPIVFVAIFISRRAGLVMAVASVATWLIMDVIIRSNYTIHSGHFWSVSIRLVFFILITYGATFLVLTLRKYRQLSNYVVHDLKSPLTNIMAGLQTIKDMDKTISDTSLQMVDGAIISSRRMLTLINSINDLWKIGDGRLEPKIEDVKIKELLGLCKEEVSMWAKKNGVSLVSNLETNREVVRTDPQLITRILVNLLSNAIKASPKNSNIEIHVKETSKDTVCFSVCDLGPGFEPIDKSNTHGELHMLKLVKNQERGAGLGLEYCRLAAKSLGGKIWFERSGEKTISTLEIPA